MNKCGEPCYFPDLYMISFPDDDMRRRSNKSLRVSLGQRQNKFTATEETGNHWTGEHKESGFVEKDHWKITMSIYEAFMVDQMYVFRPTLHRIG